MKEAPHWLSAANNALHASSKERFGPREVVEEQSTVLDGCHDPEREK